jgi:hypothetical protein
MSTFRERFCEQHRCSPATFVQKVFWASLYPHAIPFAAIILLVNREFFSADRALILSAGDATTMKKIREDVRDYFWDSTNRGWLRRTANIRVSGQRLKNIARRYLPEGASIPFPPRSSR